MIKKGLLSILTFGLALLLTAQDKKEYKGLLWEITGNGMSKPSYLYGTMHISKKLAFHLSDTFFIAISSADVVALETNPGEWMENMMKKDRGYSAYNSYDLWGNYGRFRQQDYYDLIFDLSIPEESYFKKYLSYDPSITNHMLYRSSFYREDFEEDTYLDLFIYQAGKKLNKKIASLEDFFESEKMVEKAYMPDEEEDKKKPKRYRYSYWQGGKSPVEMLEEAYRKGDLSTLDSLMEMQMPSKNFRKYMLDERNIVMAENMDSIMKNRSSLFAAIGAAHLPGDMGVISLLRKKNYTVRAVSPFVSKYSAKKKDKIEKTFFPGRFENQLSEDTAFSVSMPGKLFRINSHDKGMEYLYPDMANGAFYSIYRIKTYGVLTGKKPGEVLRQIDSMIYENIPGKIISKTEIRSNNNYPGIEITNRTRRGDLQKYRIFALPNEIYIFKLGGTGDYIEKTSEARRFFNSIKFLENNRTEWKTWSPPGSDFELSVPANYISQVNEMDNTYGINKDIILTASESKSGTSYLFIRTTWYDFSYFEEDTFELNVLTEKTEEQTGYKLQSRKHAYSSDGYPAVDAVYKKDERYLYTRVILQGYHYNLLAVAGEGEKDPSGFFKSFRTTTGNNLPEYIQHNDTALHFSVRTPFKPEDNNMGSARWNYNLWGSRKKKKLKDESYKAEYKNSTFINPSGAEVVRVNYRKFNRYESYKDSAAYWKSKLSMNTYSDDFIVKKKNAGKKDGYEFMELVLADTGSSKVQRMRIFLRNGVEYTVASCYDSIRGCPKWVNTFYETFTPSDSVKGESIYKSKADLYFCELNSSDTSETLMAQYSAYYVDLRDEDMPQLIQFVESPAFSKLDDETRSGILNLFNRRKHPDIVPAMKRLYELYTDSATMQIEILETLARQKTEEATLAFAELMDRETPLMSNNYGAGRIFEPFYDSLPIAAKLFPKILNLTWYDEYKSTVYSLLEELLDSNYIKPQDYAHHTGIILKEAKEELKRKIGDKDKNNLVAGLVFDDESYGEENSLYSSYGYYYGGRGNSRTSQYITLLMPFYNEKQVASYFDKVKKMKDDNLNFYLNMSYLKNKMQVADTTLNRYATQDKYRYDLYRTLEKLKTKNKFNASYLDQECMARSYFYKKERLQEKDSVIFIEKHFIRTKRDSGYVYFYKFKREGFEEEEWQLGYNGLFPKDGPLASKKRNFSSQEIVIKNEEKDIREKINQELKSFRMLDRRDYRRIDYSAMYEFASTDY